MAHAGRRPVGHGVVLPVSGWGHCGLLAVVVCSDVGVAANRVVEWCDPIHDDELEWCDPIQLHVLPVSGWEYTVVSSEAEFCMHSARLSLLKLNRQMIICI